MAKSDGEEDWLRWEIVLANNDPGEEVLIYLDDDLCVRIPGTWNAENGFNFSLYKDKTVVATYASSSNCSVDRAVLIGWEKERVKLESIVKTFEGHRLEKPYMKDYVKHMTYVKDNISKMFKYSV